MIVHHLGSVQAISSNPSLLVDDLLDRKEPVSLDRLPIIRDLLELHKGLLAPGMEGDPQLEALAHAKEPADALNQSTFPLAQRPDFDHITHRSRVELSNASTTQKVSVS